MKIEWNPTWFELDQTVIVGDTDFFYLTRDGNSFANKETSLDDQEVYGEVVKIVHADLAEVRGILAEGLSYRIFTDEGDFIQVDAEENIGMVEYPADCRISDWNFQVELDIHKATGLSSLERMERTTGYELSKDTDKRKANYRRLLGVEAF